MTGQVVHFEIPADDLDRASRFYAEAFGWQLQPAIPDMGYILATTSETEPGGAAADAVGINGALRRRDATATAPVVTIQVDDIDSTLTEVERLGGRVAVGRQPVGEIGFSAYFSDSEGNLLGLWQNAG